MKISKHRFTTGVLAVITLLALNIAPNRILGAAAPRAERDIRLEKNPFFDRENLCSQEFERVIGAPTNWEAYGFISARDCSIRRYLPNFYEILGFSDTNASSVDIKKSFYQAARSLHPDRTLGLSDIERKIATEMFKRINNAQEALRDADSKRAYDAQLTANHLLDWELTASNKEDNDNITLDFLTRFVAHRNLATGPASDIKIVD